MLPYCKMSAIYGYRVIIVEPETEWKRNPRQVNV